MTICIKCFLKNIYFWNSTFANVYLRIFPKEMVIKYIQTCAYRDEYQNAVTVIVNRK